MASDLMPCGVWVRLQIPDFKPVIAYTYLDSQAGFSAKGGVIVASLRENPYAPYVHELEQTETAEPRVPFAVPYPLRVQPAAKAPERKWWQFWR